VYILLYSLTETENISLEMTPNQRHAFEALRELPPPEDQGSDQWITLDSVMDGKHPLNVSHAGGELSALTDMANKWDEL